MAEYKLKCLCCGSSKMAETGDGFKCSNCGALIKFTLAYMNHLELFKRAAEYIDSRDYIAALKVLDELDKCSTTCPETYWYRLIADYGIEISDGKTIFNRENSESILKNANYLNALKFSGYYMEKTFKSAAAAFENARINGNGRTASDNTDTLSSDSLDEALGMSGLDFSSKRAADSEKIKPTGITVESDDYKHEGHNHCSADNSYNAYDDSDGKNNKTNYDAIAEKSAESLIEQDEFEAEEYISEDDGDLYDFDSDNQDDIFGVVFHKITEEKEQSKNKTKKRIMTAIIPIMVLLFVILIVFRLTTGVFFVKWGVFAGLLLIIFGLYYYDKNESASKIKLALMIFIFIVGFIILFLVPVIAR